ncbi:MAG: hypothetical protein WBW14_24975 [Candidatus Acidiferrum sp.]|jgi:hypothetical protein
MSIDHPPVVVNLGERSASKSLSGGPHQIALEDLVLDELPAINVLVLLNVRTVGNPSFIGKGRVARDPITVGKVTTWIQVRLEDNAAE